MEAKLRCAIEMEPMTLNQGQLNLAREIAVEVQKKEASEASETYLEELRTKEVAQNSEKREQIAVIVETSCQCACACGITESPDLSQPNEAQLKEPLSAPF
ncbi:hypothetical protein NMG60_11005066 [Bertholletia excelsa]